MSRRMTRREMLKGLGLAAAGGLLASCAPKVVKETVVVEKIVEKPVEKIVKETVIAEGTAVVTEKVITATPAPLEPVTIHVWDYDPTGDDAWVEADKTFQEDYWPEKYPYINVEFERAPWTGFTEKFLTSLAGGAKYDVIYGWWGWRSLFIENNVIVPLDVFLMLDGEYSEDDFIDGAKETFDGKLYGLAWAVHTDMLWYNQSATKDAGYPALQDLNKQGKWDYDDMYEFAKALTSEKDGAPVYGIDLQAMKVLTATYYGFARNWGTDIWDEGFTKCLMDSPENIALWKWMQRFFTEELSPLPGQGSAWAEVGGFGDERIISHITGTWYMRTIQQQGIQDKFDLGMVPLPKGPGGQHASTYINSYYMGKGEHPEEGWMWYKERSFSDKFNELYAPIGIGRFPALKGQKAIIQYDYEDIEVYDAIRPQLVLQPVGPKEAEYVALYGPAFDEMVLATRPVEEILGQLAEEATALLSA